MVLVFIKSKLCKFFLKNQMILKMFMFLITRGDYFRSDSIFIKKITKIVFFEKNRNRFKPTGFGYFGKKPVQTGLAWFFSGLGSVRFFRF